MATLNISLPEPMRAFIEAQTRTGGYSTASEYVRSLVRDDQKRKAGERLEAMLLEGLESGEARKLSPEDWEQVRRQVQERLAARA